MKAIIIGGFGRSGTSMLRDWFIGNRSAVSFGKAEGKFFVEPYGLLDLFRAFVTDYSHARATVAAKEFEMLMLRHLPDPAFTGQPSLIGTLDAAGRAAYPGIVHDYLASLKDGEVPIWLSADEFHVRTRVFLKHLLVLFAGDQGVEDRCFVEKTPHNALNPEIFLHLFHPAHLVWIIRDPRAVVYSTSKFDWGPGGIDAAVSYVRQVIRRYLAMRDRFGGYEVRLEDLEAKLDAVVEGLRAHTSFAVDPSGEPFRSDVAQDWKRYLQDDALARVEAALAPEINALGYR